MKKITLFLSLLLSLSLFTACSDMTTEPSEGDLPENTNSEEVQEVEETVVEREEGSINMDFPTTVALESQAGEYVLSPSPGMLEGFYEDPTDNNVIFYNQKMVTPGEKESVLEHLFDGEYSVPNSMIVPIPAGQVAEKGDMLVSWWQSGSGMRVVKVLEGGATPFITYMSVDFDIDDQNLKEDSFVKLTGDYMPGAPVVVYVPEDDEYIYEVMISEADGKVLTLGFAGFMYVRDKSNVKPINVYDDYQVGDTVYASVIGGFEEGVIASIDNENGLVDVTHSWAGSEKTETFPIYEITKALE